MFKTRKVTRDVGPLDLRAEINPSSVDEKARTFEIVWSTGARVLRNSWWDGPSYEELSMAPGAVRMARFESGAAPFLMNHDGGDVSRQPGRIVSARIENGKGIATIQMDDAGNDDAADRLFGKIKSGVVRNVSIGYRTYKTEKAGEDNKVPIYRAIDWEPFEASMVTIPADAGAGLRSQNPKQFNQCELDTREEEKLNVTEEQKQALELKRQQDALAAEKAAFEAEKAKAAAEKAESERQASVRSLCAKLSKDEAFTKRMVDEKKSLEQVREIVLNEIAERSDKTAPSYAGAIEIGAEAGEKWARGASQGLIARLGFLAELAAVTERTKKSRDDKDAILNPNARKHFKDFDGDDDGGHFRGMSIVDMARDFCEAHGIQVRGKYGKAVLDAAMSHRSGGDQTISDFAVVLENVMYKVLLARYAQAADTWRRFCGTDSVQDFRSANRYRMGSFGVLPLKPEGAEYQLTAIPDGFKIQIATQTYGQKIAISREAIVNDDMGAILDQMGQFGRAAGLTIEKAVYALLAQNAGLGPTVTVNGVTQTFFHSAFGNVGSGAAMSMASFEADRVTMGSQLDPNSQEYLDLRPRTLLVPLGLGGVANQINRAKYDPTSGAAFEAPNIVGGLFNDVVDTPRLSGTRRYMFVDPAIVAALKVVFLNGDQTPYMAEKLNWNVDGQEVKLRLDAKAQTFDPKGALTNAGV